MTQFFFASALVIALLTAGAGVTQASSLVLRQPVPPYYWPRHRTTLSGRYHNNTWVVSPYTRTRYSQFRGGGFGFGK